MVKVRTKCGGITVSSNVLFSCLKCTLSTVHKLFFGAYCMYSHSLYPLSFYKRPTLKVGSGGMTSYGT